ncbi:hypothetical protein D3C85_1451970 [compost metagenome]
MFQQLLDHFHSTGKFDGGGISGFQVGKYQRIDGAMLLLGFVIHDVLLLAPGFFIRRVQHFLFKTGMDRDFHFQFGQ